MKLKMGTAREAVILSVMGTIESRDILVMRAGLKKLFESKKRSVLLDLSMIKESDFKHAGIIAEISILPKWAKENGAQLVIAGAVNGIEGIIPLDRGIKLLNSNLSKLLVKEAILQEEVTHLEGVKKEISKRITAVRQAEDMCEIQKMNSNLKKLIKTLEEETEQYLSKRKKPSDEKQTESKEDHIKENMVIEILKTVLEQEGIIKVST